MINRNDKILITGGCGFIGTALIEYLIKNFNVNILNIDKLKIKSNYIFHNQFLKHKNYQSLKLNICNVKEIEKVFLTYEPNYVIHMAAETHVDTSIDKPYIFLKNNIEGTFILLETIRKYLKKIPKNAVKKFKLLSVSTDEVFGSSKPNSFFKESTRYNPSSPYSASKASADHLVKAYFKTYDIPVIISNCSNNYGPYQLPEKLIPLMIIKALNGESLPIYGDGKQVRDWLYVYDHAEALLTILTKGSIGESYNIGGGIEISNLNVVKSICENLKDIDLVKKTKFQSFNDQVSFVKDRPGHDRRYAIDFSKLKSSLGWAPKVDFNLGIKKTIMWYLKNYYFNKNKISLNSKILKRQGIKF